MNTKYDLSHLAAKRVLVTGAGGFVGSHLLPRLKETGAEILAVDRPGISLQTESTGMAFKKIDLTKPVALQKTITEFRPQNVIHLAAMTDVARDWTKLRSALEANIVATLNLCEACAQLDTMPRVVILGTSEEYGDQVAPFDEKMQVRPVSPYSWSKVAVTHLAGMVYRTFGLPTVVLRPFLVYGPRQPQKMLLASLITTLLAGKEFEMTAGEQTRDFVYVEDLADAILLAAVRDQAVGEIINVCSGQDTQIRQVAREIATRLKSETLLKMGALPYRKGEAMRLVGDASRARTLLGFSTSTTLEEGLALTLEWYKNHPQESNS